MIATVLEFEVLVVDGDGLSVADLDVGARFKYESAASTWSTARTDGDGWARFRDDHPEPPTEACLFVADRPCDTVAIHDGAHLTLEL